MCSSSWMEDVRVGKAPCPSPQPSSSSDMEGSKMVLPSSAVFVGIRSFTSFLSYRQIYYIQNVTHCFVIWYIFITKCESFNVESTSMRINMFVRTNLFNALGTWCDCHMLISSVIFESRDGYIKTGCMCLHNSMESVPPYKERVA